ncbi:hypothetical protein PQQ51_02420 [Paraburkholderia xenovorans]
MSITHRNTIRISGSGHRTMMLAARLCGRPDRGSGGAAAMNTFLDRLSL